MRPIIRREGLALLAGALAAGGLPVRAQTVAEGVSLASYRSGEADVACVVFTPRQPGGPMAGAAILLLNGGGGTNNDIRRFYEDAVGLSDKGYVVIMPNYLGVTSDPEDRRNAAIWRQVVVDGAVWAGTLPGVDPARVGTMGFSRGGWLACDAGLTEANVKAVVGIASGGNLRAEQMRRKPPVLLIYASGDPIVPPRVTRAWERTLKDAQVPVETYVVDSPRHVLQANEWHLVFDTAHAFFRRTLAA